MTDHSEGFYDALICESGHLINKKAIRGRSLPEDSPFCGVCGAKGVRTCGHCNGYIRGVPIQGETILSEKSITLYNPAKSPYSVPGYCEKCGRVFAWTEARLKAASDFLDLAEKLSAEEKAQLRADLPALASENPQTPLAVARWKKAMAKVGADVYGISIKVIGDLAASTIKGQFGL